MREMEKEEGKEKMRRGLEKSIYMYMTREMAREIKEEKALRDKERRTRRLDRAINIAHDWVG